MHCVHNACGTTHHVLLCSWVRPSVFGVPGGVFVWLGALASLSLFLGTPIRFWAPRWVLGMFGTNSWVRPSVFGLPGELGFIPGYAHPFLGSQVGYIGYKIDRMISKVQMCFPKSFLGTPIRFWAPLLGLE